MRDYRITVKLKGPTGTAWHSDTIFGHLCWQVVHGALNMTIEEFLSPFLDGSPPFVLSDGFPAGLLPRPILYRFETVVKDRRHYATAKRWRRADYVTEEDFQHIRRGERPTGVPVDNPWHSIVTSHASMDRNTTTTSGAGGLYETEATYLPSHPGLDVYVRTRDEWWENVVSLFQAMAHSGFGRDKSTGLGMFEMMKAEEYSGFASNGEANWLVSLSSVVPAPADPINAYYHLRIKHGKLGEGRSVNPFKRPLLQMEVGAMIRTTGTPPDYCGTLIKEIAPGFPDAVQNCYGLAVPCRVRD